MQNTSPTPTRKTRNLRSLLIFGSVAAAFFIGIIIKTWLFGR